MNRLRRLKWHFDVDTSLIGACQVDERMRDVQLNSYLYTSFLFFIEWLGDNHFLLQRHRPPAHSVIDCLISIGSIHSETVNIWTHLIGALCVTLTFALFLWDNSKQLDLSDFISFSIFFFSAIICLTFSTLLHIFINYSPSVLITVSKLDYIGRC